MNRRFKFARRAAVSLTAVATALLSLSSCCCAPQCDSCSRVDQPTAPIMAQATPLTAAAPALQTVPAAQTVALDETPIKNPDEALQRLMEGNKRYVAWNLLKPNDNAARRMEMAKGQQPFATIFSCVDSRVPPELVFDRGLGDLFVARTAGQVLDRAVLGSIEFGAVKIHIPLIMVLGHKRCGAVKATIDTMEKNGHADGNIDALVDGIRPAVEKAKTAGGELLEKAIRTNVELTVERLKHEPMLVELVKKGELKVVGGVYDLDTGEVQLTTP